MVGQEKTKEERVAEGMTILFKLREVGIEDSNPGVKIIKDAIRAWISDGIPVTLKRIEFGRLNRLGELILPRRAGVQPSLLLRVIEGAEAAE